VDNCYKILDVSPQATVAEIKRAFRQKAKMFHPDLVNDEEKEAKSEAFQQLLRAYEILTDHHQRAIFDSSYMARFHKNWKDKSEYSFDYRKWLLERTDEESKCKLILFDLLHHHESDAVALFLKMNRENLNFRLSRWLTRENFMDYGFILAEELIIRFEYYDALILLEQIIKMEFSFNYFRHFFPEVQSLTLDVLRRHIIPNYSDELIVDSFERALELQFSKKEDAWFLLQMGKAYERLGDEQTAELCIQEALRFDKTLKL